jgi:hypothetical protein
MERGLAHIDGAQVTWPVHSQGSGHNVAAVPRHSEAFARLAPIRRSKEQKAMEVAELTAFPAHTDQEPEQCAMTSGCMLNSEMGIVRDGMSDADSD